MRPEAKICLAALAAASLTTATADARERTWLPPNGQGHRWRALSNGGKDVLLIGSLNDGKMCAWAIARPDAPGQPVAGLGSGCGGKPVMAAPNGDIVYSSDSFPSTVHRMVPDPFRWRSARSTWDYPEDPPVLNDPVVAPHFPDCPGHARNFVMQQGTGALLIECPSKHGEGYDYYDVSGTLRLKGLESSLLAWNRNGLKLSSHSSRPGTPVAQVAILDTAGVLTPVPGVPTRSLRMTQRTHADGFWVALENDELWFVGPRGAALKEGTFAPLPSGVSRDLSRVRALDFWGALYHTAVFKNGRVVVKRPLLPAKSRIVYSDVDVPRNDWSRTPPRLHLWISESFVTGP